MTEIQVTQFFLLLTIFAVGGFIAGGWFETAFGKTAAIRNQRDDAEARYRVAKSANLKLVEELLKHYTWTDIKNNVLKDINLR